MVERDAAVLKGAKSDEVSSTCSMAPLSSATRTHHQPHLIAVKLLLIVRLRLEPLDEIVPQQPCIVLDGNVPLGVGPPTISIGVQGQKLPLVDLPCCVA